MQTTNINPQVVRTIRGIMSISSGKKSGGNQDKPKDQNSQRRFYGFSEKGRFVDVSA